MNVTRLAGFLRSPMFPIFMTVFVDILGVGMSLPVLPLYAQNTHGASAVQVTLLASAYFGAQFLAAPRLGRLSDRLGRRPVLILSQAGTFTALLMSGGAPSLPFLFLARTVDGLTGGNVSVAQAYLSDITDESNRARGLGVVNAALSSGFVFGPALGALIAAYWGPRAPFFVAAGISLITISLSIFLLPESLTPERRREDADRRAGQPMSLRAMFGLPGMAALMAVAFSAQLAFFGFQATYVLWTEKVLLAGSDPRVVQQAIGGILTFVGVCGIITQVWLVGPLVRRYGERMLVAGGVVLRALGWALMAAIPVLSATLVAIPLLAAGQGILLPALGALVTYLAPRQRGQAIGLLESSQGFGRVTGPLIAGVLFDQIHPSAPLVAAAILSVGTALASAALWRVPLKKEASAEPR